MRIYTAYASSTRTGAGNILRSENGANNNYCILEAKAGSNDRDVREQLQFALQKTTDEPGDGTSATILKMDDGDATADFLCWGAGAGSVTTGAHLDSHSGDLGAMWHYKPETANDLIWAIGGATGGLSVQLVKACASQEIWAWIKFGEVG